MNTSTTMNLEDFMRQRKSQMQNRSDDLEYISAEEYAIKLHISAGAIRKRCREGKIPNAIKEGSRWLIGIKPTFSREEMEKLQSENVKLKDTLREVMAMLVGVI